MWVVFSLSHRMADASNPVAQLWNSCYSNFVWTLLIHIWCFFATPQGVLPKEWNHVWNWKEYYADCCKFAKTLIHLDVAAFKITNILGFNSVSFTFISVSLRLSSVSYFTHYFNRNRLFYGSFYFIVYFLSISLRLITSLICHSLYVLHPYSLSGWLPTMAPSLLAASLLVFTPQILQMLVITFPNTRKVKWLYSTGTSS